MRTPFCVHAFYSTHSLHQIQRISREEHWWILLLFVTIHSSFNPQSQNEVIWLLPPIETRIPSAERVSLYLGLIVLGGDLLVLQLYLAFNSQTPLARDQIGRTGFGVCLALLMGLYGNKTISMTTFSRITVAAFLLFFAITVVLPAVL